MVWAVFSRRNCTTAYGLFRIGGRGVHRPHRAVAQRLRSAFGQHFHRQATFEKPVRSGAHAAADIRFEFPQGNPFRAGEFLHQSAIFRFRQRAVEIIPGETAPRIAEGNRPIDGVRADDRRDGVVKIQVLRAGELAKRIGERGRGERSGGHDRRSEGNLHCLLPAQFDPGMRTDRLRDGLCERFAIHRQRRPRGNRMLQRASDQE